MIAAEQQGVFRTQPKHLWYFRKAHLTSDLPHVDIGENPELSQAAPKVLNQRRQSDYHRKVQALKDKGVNAFGMAKQAVNELAEEHGIS